MLPKSYRLRRSADVRRVQRRGKGQRHPLAILLVTEGLTEKTRFAFVAGRSVGNAVRRNRAKRLLREAVRLRLDGIVSGRDCVFIARRRTPDASFAEVEGAVQNLLRRADLLEAEAFRS
jgi:ribonuclease P protein component